MSDNDIFTSFFGGATNGLTGQDRKNAEAFLRIITKAPTATLGDAAILAKNHGLQLQFAVKADPKAETDE